MITIKRYTELSDKTRGQLDTFIQNEFGHIPIVRETEWAEPNWTIICYDNGEINSFYNIIEREILLDGIPYKCAGINNVITPKVFRGKGLASKMLKETEYFIFEDLKCNLGLLLCADALIPFYQKLGWYLVNCQTYIEQSEGQKLWQANTMILTKSEQLNPIKIELNGLPW